MAARQASATAIDVTGHAGRLAAVFVMASALMTAVVPSASPDVGYARTALPGGSAPASVGPPVLAYYYIWFDARAWSRGKADYPLLGRYASDDVEVMRQHIRWAKQAGIDGFIVSWRHTDVLDTRLAKLVNVATDEMFSLSIVYQGLDFFREPRAAATIHTDLEWFADTYAGNPVFHVFGRPVVVVTGTERYSRAEIGKITETVRDRIHVLASEKDKIGYERIADLVDGDAYYWSSVNPDTYPNYDEKLASIGEAVHNRNGLWLAPAAVGFDARLIGGSAVVDRRDGATLRRELKAALTSDPDAVGLISWNEFSENSHVEPSETFGSRYLEVLSDELHGAAINDLPVESAGSDVEGRILDDSDSAAGQTPYWGGVRAVLVFGALLAAAIYQLRKRSLRPSPGHDE